MTITLRQETAAGATTKGSALTYAELDNNFVHLLRQGSVTVRGDSGTDQTLGEEDKDSILNFVGGTNVTTAIGSDSAGDTQITINATAPTPDFAEGVLGGTDITVTSDSTGQVTVNYTGSAIANVVEDTTPQLGGDLDCQGNTISNPVLEDYAETIHSLGSTDTPTITVSNGNVQSVTITSGLTLPAFSDAATGQSVTLLVSGSGTASGTAAYRFAGGNKTLTTLSVVSIFYDGTNYFASIATDFQA